MPKASKQTSIHTSKVLKTQIDSSNSFRWVEDQFQSLQECPSSEHHLDCLLNSLPRGDGFGGQHEANAGRPPSVSRVRLENLSPNSSRLGSSAYLSSRATQHLYSSPATSTAIIQFPCNSSEMDASDIKTNYSDSASIATVPLESFVTEFVDDLLGIVQSEKANSHSTERLFKALPQLLQSFAYKIGHRAASKEQLEIMAFVNKYRMLVEPHLVPGKSSNFGAN